MNKIKSMILACLLLASVGVEAKSMKDLLISMPDSLVPYLNQNLRQEMPELQEMGVKAEVKNLLGENSVMDTLTADFLQIRMSKVATLQVKKLPWLDGALGISGAVDAKGADSLLCVIKTFAAPEKESEVMFFTQNWKAVDGSKLFDCPVERLIQKPDTMSEEKFVELKQMIEPQMMNALLLQHENSIVVRLSLPLVSAEDKKALNAIKVQRKFKWNGKTFNES